MQVRIINRFVGAGDAVDTGSTGLQVCVLPNTAGEIVLYETQDPMSPDSGQLTVRLYAWEHATRGRRVNQPVLVDILVGLDNCVVAP